ncbi:calmin-like [Salvelinus fontinalis]|uniref:calmin-like n=1 Tax=Salvelinus fontinalis TaxID=8038 RepID=UPI002484DFCE|nr:calmin-like [Salvelinus fontinalis]
MAGHEWEYKDWFEREEFIGQISDIRVQNLQVEREVVQKRTFTRWMNLHLEKCTPPMEVNDLFRDIQDGRILMALLEELSGCKLLHGWKQSSHRIFRLNNIAKVLTFLEERNVKLVSIDAADVADGNSSIVLGLIWNIILFFQIKELTGNIKSQFPSSSSLSSLPTSSDSDTSHSSTPSDERPRSIAMRDHGKAIKTLLQWVQRRTRKYGVAVQDFGKSWTSGLAFLAVIKSIDPSLVDMRRALLRTARENLEDAFRTAHYSLGIPRLLEPEDVTINPPDEQSIMTYVSQFLEHFPGMEEPQENVSDVIQRSVSSGRLSCRVNDSSHDLRNGVHRSRDRERPFVVRRDLVQHPPKILISSVSEELKSPTSPPVVERSPVNEGSSVGTTPSSVFTVSTSSSPQPSFVNSVIGSVSCDSPISDSVIGSPDSCWERLPSEAVTPDRSVGSRSDGSLCDSGVSWDIPPSTPHGVTPDLEDPLPSVMGPKAGKPQDEEQEVMPELLIDEGNYSFSSVESTQYRANTQLEEDGEGRKKKEKEDEEEAYTYILELGEQEPDQREGKNITERTGSDSEGIDTTTRQRNGVNKEQGRPSLEFSDKPQHTDSDQKRESVCEGESVCVGESVCEGEIGGAVCSPQHKDISRSQQETPDLHEKPNQQDGVLERTDRASECAKKETVEPSTDSRKAGNPEEGFATERSDKAEGQSDVTDRGVTEHRPTTSLSERDRNGERSQEESEERHKQVTEESETQKKMKDVLNGHIESQENTTTQADEVTEQSQLYMEMDQSQTIQGGSSEPEEESHTGKKDPESLSCTDNRQSSTLPAEDREDRTQSPEREAEVGDEDPDLRGPPGGGLVEKRETAPCGGDAKVNVVVPEKKRGAENGHDRVDATGSGATDNRETVVEVPHQGTPVSIIPLDMVYYPHYDVPISHVTEAFPGLVLTGPVPRSPPSDTHTKNQSLSLPPGQERDIEKDAEDHTEGSHSETEASTLEERGDKMADTEKSQTKSVNVAYTDSERSSAMEKPESEPMDLFHADMSGALDQTMTLSETLEPMDLFYPDTDDCGPVEEPENDVETSPWSSSFSKSVETWPSTFSVAALQPAPSSEPEPETHTGSHTHSQTETHTETHAHSSPDSHMKSQLDQEDLREATMQKQDKVEVRGGSRLSGPQEWCSVLGEQTERDGGVVETHRGAAESSDLTRTDEEKPASAARENNETMRREGDSDGTTDEQCSMCSTPLHQRKVVGSNEKDNQKNGASSRTHSTKSDTSWREMRTPTSLTEYYILLLLWLLLYCLLVLPQIDYRNLPSLLLNLGK